jgi:beta-glucosidase
MHTRNFWRQKPKHQYSTSTSSASKVARLNSEILLGYANSMFQGTGEVCGASNWTDAAKQLDAKGNPKVPPAGISIEHWKNFEKDLAVMAAQGVNTYRFSIEWSMVEPEIGCYDMKIINRYKEMLKACNDLGITPMVTLLHFAEPLWFTNLGGFEKEENISYFTLYCVQVFHYLSEHVQLWGTINEPGVQVLQSYINGDFPPFEKRNIQKAVNVLTNLLKAHVDVYHTLKSMHGGSTAKIGLIHNMLKFVPKEKSYFLNTLTASLTEITNNLVMEFIKSGNVKLKWLLASKKYTDLNPRRPYDFLGLNFYSTAVIGYNAQGKLDATCLEGQVMSDMFLPINPHSFAAAIDEFEALGVPFYITETGIADNDLEKGKDDRRRQEFYKSYLEVFKEKLMTCKNLRGLYLWTFVKNYEWNQGYTKDFGIFDQNREPRGESTKIVTDFFQHFKSLRNADHTCLHDVDLRLA